jgi:hypothetical protein
MPMRSVSSYRFPSLSWPVDRVRDRAAVDFHRINRPEVSDCIVEHLSAELDRAPSAKEWAAADSAQAAWAF